MSQRLFRPSFDPEQGNESSITLAEEEQRPTTFLERLEHFTWVHTKET